MDLIEYILLVGAGATAGVILGKSIKKEQKLKKYKRCFDKKLTVGDLCNAQEELHLTGLDRFFSGMSNAAKAR